ncbi:chromosomal protein D1 [Paralichthys olivaceus]|uniref:chromosomal protein D1 n=1 Tax=Paralichthys olivaceus TaxID=8255 RepID=UPI0037526D1F
MEEEIKMAETEQGDDAGKEGESSADISINSSPIKRRRGRPQGSKKLKVCVTDVSLMELVSGISNGGSTQPQRGRGRPKLLITKHTEQEVSGDALNSVPTHRGKGRPKGSKNKTSKGDSTPKKRGRPKKSLSNNTPGTEQLPNGGSVPPKMKRGRPKGSVKRVSESGKEGEGSSVKRKRGRPKGSPNKKPRLQTEVSSEGEADTDGSLNSPTERVGGRLRSTQSNGISDTPKRRRGRPRKNQVTDGSQPVKRGRGRPKGSLNKKRPASKVQGTISRSQRVQVRPLRLTSSPPSKRGRPRKNPLPTPVERNKPKVWKPLGRPRKYPRVDPPEGAPTAPRRSRGRPRKSESKKGAHLRKRLPATSSPSNPDRASQRKSGQALSTAKNEAVVPRKRGRPKGSVNKNKARVETELDRASADGSKEKSDAPAVEEEHEAEPAEEEVERDVQTTSTEHMGNTEDMLIEQDANFEVSDQA